MQVAAKCGVPNCRIRGSDDDSRHFGIKPCLLLDLQGQMRLVT